MPSVKISLRISFATPPSVGAGGVTGTLADKVVTRDARGRFIIPASQVKGKLRHACKQLLRAQGVPLCHPPQPERMCPHDEDVKSPPCLLCKVFGSPAERSRLRFHDLAAEESESHGETLRAMVSLNRRRRTAEAQRLFLVETAPNVSGLLFGSEEAITGYVEDGGHLQLLLAGLRMLFAWGGGASRGLGWGELTARAWLDGQEVQLDIEEVKALCPSSPSA